MANDPIVNYPRGGSPSPNVPVSELWQKLQAMPRPHREVDFPRYNAEGECIGKVAMQVLTQEEQMICSAAAEKWTKEKLKEGTKGDLGYETIYANEAVVQILFRSCRDPNSEGLTRTAFPTPSAIRSFTQDECSVLFQFYLSVQLELGPIVATLSKAELDAWTDRIAAGGLAASPFVLLSPDMQKIQAHFMASQLVAFRNGGSSVGSLPVETSNEEPSEEPNADSQISPDAG